MVSMRADSAFFQSRHYDTVVKRDAAQQHSVRAAGLHHLPHQSFAAGDTVQAATRRALPETLQPQQQINTAPPRRHNLTHNTYRQLQRLYDSGEPPSTQPKTLPCSSRGPHIPQSTQPDAEPPSTQLRACALPTAQMRSQLQLPLPRELPAVQSSLASLLAPQLLPTLQQTTRRLKQLPIRQHPRPVHEWGRRLAPQARAHRREAEAVGQP